MITAYVALGANLGDRDGNLRAAVREMGKEAGMRVGRVARFIETEPVGGPTGQRRFLNSVAEVETELGARELLGKLLGIERRMGRERAEVEKDGPRVIDLDLLLYGEQVIDEEGLHVPHVRMHERRFVLEPLAEIAGEAMVPGQGRVRELLARLHA